MSSEMGIRNRAHPLGFSADSIGVCMIGGLDEKGRAKADFTLVQWSTLARLVHELTLRFPKARVYGHRDFARKECPCFDAAAWWRSVRQEYDV